MKIPKSAQKVFEGVLFNVYHWQQKMFDGTTQTFEMISRKPSVDVIATVGNNILLLQQEQPTKPLFPSLPGGMLEEEESHKIAAKRELLEETGYSSSKLKLLFEWEGKSKEFFHECTFVARECKKVQEQHLDGGEKIRVTLVSFDDFLQSCRNPLFTAPLGLKFIMYEALLDEKKKEELRKMIYG